MTKSFGSTVIPLTAFLTAAMLASLSSASGADPPRQRPNILIILADDMGFSDLGCYGGEINTPNLDALARDGLRFTQFYNTARCWPTRSALLTGYYAQQVRMDPPRGLVPAWTQPIPQLLKPLGYRSYHSGKWHVSGVPKTCADGGFDHSYRIEDYNHNFSPAALFEDDQKLPAVPAHTGYYTATAFADHTIKYLKEHAERYADHPFFAYLAFTTPHFPLQAPAEDIARYNDRYIKGWDLVRAERYRRQRELGVVDCALSEPEPQLRAPGDLLGVEDVIGAGELEYALPWARLTEEQKRFQAAKMAVHAAMVDRIDQEVGRVLAQVRAMGAWDDTVVFFLSDNGASAEMLVRGDGNDRTAPPGSAESFLCLGPGWSTVSNTPFRRHKIWVQEGGISTPLIVHWPHGISGHGELRHDMGHVIDLLPTLYELAADGAPAMPPAAPPLPGRSLVPEFARDGAVKRDFLFFDHAGNRALREGDWKLVSAKIDDDRWALYDLAVDRAEARDLAAQEPDRVRRMATRWKELEDEYRREAGEPEPNARQKTKSKK